MRVLNVAEKNDAARTISQILSSGQSNRREGQSKYNKIYEFPYNLFGTQCLMVMTSLSGHLMDMHFPAAVDKKWQACAPEALFDVPVEKCVDDSKQSSIQIKRTLEQEARKAERLIIWTDCDREGENIGFEVIDVCRKVNPRLRIHRAKFSDMTPPALNRAVTNLGEPDDRQSKAVDVRMELDLRTGSAFTRFQSLRFQRLFPDVIGKHILSYGSCQFPTLGFVVDRFKQIESFIAEDFWRIEVTHVTGQSERTKFNWERVRLFDQRACRAIYAIVQESPTATVTSVSSRPKSKWRPQALDTVELEKLAVRKLRLTAKETMKIAEDLYTKGFISYPRTETNKFPPDLNLGRLVEQHVGQPQWGQFAELILNNGGPKPRNGKKSDNAHPPIHPTKCVTSSNDLPSQNTWKVYELIARHFLACVSADAEGRESIVEIVIAGESFSATGLQILARNYLDVYPYDTWTDHSIPNYTEGQRFEPTSIEMTAGQTSPPSLLTEADLIALMEKHGIGTDATHAEHIEKIVERRYVGRTPDNRFTPGELGMGFVEGYDAMGHQLSKPQLRAEFEADLKRICDGQANATDILERYKAKYREIFVQSQQLVSRLDEAMAKYLRRQPNQQPLPPHNGFGGGGGGGNGGNGPPPPGGSGGSFNHKLGSCPKCSADILFKTTRQGALMFGCAGYPTCKVSSFLPGMVERVNILDEVCQKCSTWGVHLVEFFFKTNEVPMGLHSPHRCCIGGCDNFILDLLGMRLIFQAGDFIQQSISNSTQAISSPPLTSTRPAASVAPFRQQNTAQRTIGQSQQNENIKSTDLSSTDWPNCDCNQRTARFTCRKEGPNQGREFFKCATQSGCRTFIWADEMTTMNNSNNYRQNNYGQPQQGSDNSSFVPKGRPFAENDRGAGSSQTCKCGLQAVLMTCRNEKNSGRQYWACKRAGEGGCGAFVGWADGESTSRTDNGADTAGQTWQQSQKRSQGYGRGSGLTNRNDSVPTERPGFLALGGGRIADGNGSSRGGRGRGSKRPLTGKGGGGVSKARKCGTCGEPGHTKKTCPSNRSRGGSGNDDDDGDY